MGLFKNLFGGKGKKPKQEEGPIPNRKLHLPYPPIPANGHLFAQKYVDAVKHNEGIDLDYSVASIEFVDQFLQKFSDEGISVDEFAESIFVAGCYVGQILIENNGGIWIADNDVSLPPGVGMMPLVIKLPNGSTADPIAKAFKRFYYGQGDNLNYFYHVITSPKT